MQETPATEHIVSELYEGYNDTQRELFDINIRKTQNKLLTLAIVIFLFDFFVLLVLNAIFLKAILMILLIPAIMIGLRFLVLKEPVLAMTIAAIIIVGLWIYNFAVLGGRSLFSLMGLLSKALIAYLIIAGFQNAIEAQKIKRELKL